MQIKWFLISELKLILTSLHACYKDIILLIYQKSFHLLKLQENLCKQRLAYWAPHTHYPASTNNIFSIPVSSVFCPFSFISSPNLSYVYPGSVISSINTSDMSFKNKSFNMNNLYFLCIASSQFQKYVHFLSKEKESTSHKNSTAGVKIIWN